MSTKIKDLPRGTRLGGIRFIYPGDGKKYYWHSQWQKGVWAKKNLKEDEVFPLFCDDLKETLEWEVVT